MIPDDLLFQQMLNASSPILIGVALNVILSALKKAPMFPNWLLPFTALAMGAVAYPALESWTARNFILGIVVGGFSVGLHQTLRQFTDRKREADAERERTGLTQFFRRNQNGGPPHVTAWVATTILVLFMVGCATPSTPQTAQDRVDRTAAIVQTSAQLGVYYAVHQDANSRAWFEAARLALTVLLDQGEIEPEQVAAVLQGLSVNELHSEDVWLAVSSAVQLYQAFYGEQVGKKLESSTTVRPVLIALRDGIISGLNSSATEKRYNLTGPKRRR